MSGGARADGGGKVGLGGAARSEADRKWLEAGGASVFGSKLFSPSDQDFTSALRGDGEDGHFL